MDESCESYSEGWNQEVGKECDMIEELVIRHCSPTLAGLKTGNMFGCPCRDRREMKDAICRLNRMLVPKGLRVLPLQYTKDRVLLYLYRPSRLKADLSTAEAGELLRREGYACADCNQCIARLMCRLREEEEFPHEIGLFLGYPPEDVKGFMEHRACGCKCVGCWKVYGDAEAAQQLFHEYEQCTKRYWERWKQGQAVEQLVVAS